MKKKYIIWGSIIILLIAFIAHSRYDASFIKYESGRDTVSFYGDGEYQIGKTSISLVLSNEKYNAILIEDIHGYKEIKGQLYVSGTYENTPIYAIVDIKQNKLKYFIIAKDKQLSDLHLTSINAMMDAKDIIAYSGTNELSDEEQKVFEQLKT